LELDSARETLANEQAENGALQRRLAELQAELAATGEALRMLRGSRLVRWSAPLRRLYYRLR
jgi:predicted nuclease with TOPRIM domain